MQTKNQQDIAFIYDYDINKKRLEYRAVKLEESSGDPLKDAIYSLCRHTHLDVDFQELDFNRQMTEDQITQILLAGKPSYQSAKDSSLFLQALDMTIAKHHDNLDYQIVMLDD